MAELLVQEYLFCGIKSLWQQYLDTVELVFLFNSKSFELSFSKALHFGMYFEFNFDFQTLCRVSAEFKTPEKRIIVKFSIRNIPNS